MLNNINRKSFYLTKRVLSLVKDDSPIKKAWTKGKEIKPAGIPTLYAKRKTAIWASAGPNPCGLTTLSDELSPIYMAEQN